MKEIPGIDFNKTVIRPNTAELLDRNLGNLTRFVDMSQGEVKGFAYQYFDDRRSSNIARGVDRNLLKGLSKVVFSLTEDMKAHGRFHEATEIITRHAQQPVEE